MAIYVDKNFGFTNSSSFTFWVDIPQIINPNISYSGIMWNFDDNVSISSTEASVEHTYHKPGEYTIKATIFISNKTSEISEIFEELFINVKVVDFLQKSIYIDNVPPPTQSNSINHFPFRVKYTASSTETHTIVVGVEDKFAYFSNNTININPQYPQWYILDTNLNLTNHITGVQTPIYLDKWTGNITDQDNGFVVGVSGYADFYVVCESSNIFEAISSTNFLSKINATLFETKDIQNVNSDITVSFPHIFKWKIPDILKISHFYNIDIPYYNWTESIHPLCITASYSTAAEHSLTTNHLDHNLFRGLPDNDPNPQLGLINVSIKNDKETLNPIFTKPTRFGRNFGALKPESFTEQFPGVCETFFSLNSSVNDKYTIEASLQMPLPSLLGNCINPTLLLSNPKTGILNKIQIQSSLNELYFHNKCFAVPKLNFPPIEESYGNLHNIKQIVSLSSPEYTFWASDDFSGIIYLYDNDGKVLRTINTRNFQIPSDTIEPEYFINPQAFVNCMMLDVDKNLWVSLENSNIIAQFSYNGKCLNILSFENEIILKFNISSDNNIWVLAWNEVDDTLNLKKISFSYPWYSNDTENFQHIEFSVDKTITENIYPYTHFVSSKTQNIVAYIDPLNSTRSIIEIWDLDFTELLTTFTTQYIISDVGIDSFNNLYYISPTGMVVKRSSSGSSKFTFLVSPTNFPISLTNLILDYRDIFYVIDSANNTIFVIKENNSSLIVKDSFIVNPSNFEGKLPLNSIEEYSSLCGFGDLNSYKWSIKYFEDVEPQLFSNTLSLSGSTHDILFLNNSSLPSIFKVNEDYNFVTNFEEIASIPSLTDSLNLKKFINECLSYSSYQTYLNTDSYIYEKISNFNYNHSNLDTCTYLKLSDYAQFVDYNLTINYLNNPMAITRLIDLCSIELHQLVGTKPSNGMNLYNLSKYGQNNRGNLIRDPQTIVETGLKIIIRDIYYDLFTVITTPELPGLNEYTIEFLARQILNLTENWKTSFEFFEYIPNETNEINTNSLIDWKSNRTNLNIEEVNSLKWMQNDGIVESLFSLELYRGLNLIKG